MPLEGKSICSRRVGQGTKSEDGMLHKPDMIVQGGKTDECILVHCPDAMRKCASQAAEQGPNMINRTAMTWIRDTTRAVGTLQQPAMYTGRATQKPDPEAEKATDRTRHIQAGENRSSSSV